MLHHKDLECLALACVLHVLTPIVNMLHGAAGFNTERGKVPSSTQQRLKGWAQWGVNQHHHGTRTELVKIKYNETIGIGRGRSSSMAMRAGASLWVAAPCGYVAVGWEWRCPCDMPHPAPFITQGRAGLQLPRAVVTAAYTGI